MCMLNLNFKVLRLLALVLSIFTIVSCADEESVSDIRFSIQLNEVAENTTTITVTHTGTNRSLYYAFAVPGEINDIGAEIEKHRSTISNGIVTEEAFDQKKRVIKLLGLSPETRYTCIVYGVDENNDICGIPCSAVFTTTSSTVEFTLNPKWQITYLGQSKINEKTYSRIDVDVIGDISERYFISVYKKEIVNEYKDIRGFLLKAYNDFNSKRNELDDEYFWIEDNFVRTGSTSHYQYLFKGSYQAFAIGVNANGALTGHYASSDVFDFERYELEPAYEELLGDWAFIDEVGGEIFFTLSENWANSTLTMSGFGYNDCPITIKYTPQENYMLTISGQSAKGVTWGEEISKTMTLRAWYLNEDDEFKIYRSSIINTLARSRGKNEDGTYTFSRGFNIALQNDENAKTVGMILTYYNEENHLFYLNSSKIQLPFTMKKIE